MPNRHALMDEIRASDCLCFTFAVLRSFEDPATFSVARLTRTGNTGIGEPIWWPDQRLFRTAAKRVHCIQHLWSISSLGAFCKPRAFILIEALADVAPVVW